MASNSRISLPRNIPSAHTLEEVKFQLAEFISKLEDYLNRQINIHFLDKNTQRPTLLKGDLVFDFTDHPNFATLQQWNGKKLVPLSLDTIVGSIDLVDRGIGSGNDRNMILASKGDGTWELRIPEQIQFNAIEFIPAFSLATAQGEQADSTDLSHFNKVIGMVIDDVSNGFIGNATVNGEIFNSIWGWAPGSKLFLNGTTISLTAPSTGFSQMVAVARNSQTIIMRIEPPILL